ncbi:MAG TPA: hypothetical protein VKB17_00675 [Thermoleophilaceae bacterium]|nr:hypothetical protein [Thermoleophilaceae bacterium]
MRSLEALDGRFGPHAVETVDRTGLVAEPPQADLQRAYGSRAVSGFITHAAAEQVGR